MTSSTDSVISSWKAVRLVRYIYASSSLSPLPSCAQKHAPRGFSPQEQSESDQPVVPLDDLLFFFWRSIQHLPTCSHQESTLTAVTFQRQKKKNIPLIIATSSLCFFRSILFAILVYTILREINSAPWL